MVRYSVFVASFFLVIVPSYLEARAYNEEYDNLDRFYDAGRPSTPDKSSKCEKDILLLMDASNSIGKGGFPTFIQPFLEAFAESKRLQFGKNGVQLVGVIPFSSEDNTRKIPEYIFTEQNLKNSPQTRDDVLKLFKQMSFDKLNPGEQSYTYTGKALELAKDIFTGPSPGNVRLDAGDVLLILTDGAPNAKGKTKEEKEKTRKNIKEMLTNGVRVIIVAIENPRLDEEVIRKYRNYMRSLVDGNDFFNPTFDTVKSIIDTLVDKSCSKFPPAQKCACSAIQPSTSYVVSDNMKTKVFWKVPEVNCTDNDQKITMKNSEYPHPSGEFGVGEKKITYSYFHGETKKKIKCDVNINVEVCKCTDVGEVKAPLLKVGESKVKVSWKIPKPNCRTNDNKPEMDNAYLLYGKNIKEYHYEIGELKLTCPVEIVVNAVPCGEKFNPNEQECCCGKVYEKKDKHDCCGYQYYDTSLKQCCPRDNVFSIGTTCPGDEKDIFNL